MNLSGPSGAAAAILGLVVLQRITSSQLATGAVAGLLEQPAALAAAWMDASVPLIPDHSAPSKPAYTSGGAVAAAAAAGANAAAGALAPSPVLTHSP